MQKRRVVAGLIVLPVVWISILCAQGEEAAYQCRKTWQVINVDGAMDEETWREAKPIEVGGECEARLLWKREALYFVVSSRKKQAVGKGMLKISVKSGRGSGLGREIEINPFDGSYKSGDFESIEVATRAANSMKGKEKSEHSWTVEAGIPLGSLLDAKSRPLCMNGLKWGIGFELLSGEKTDAQKSVEIELQGIPTPVLSDEERRRPYVTGSYWKNICRDYPLLGSQWFGCDTVSDGRCFFAVSSHQGIGAHLFCYNPARKEAELVADMAEVVGEKGKDVTQQGKIHSELIEMDGVLYFATCMAFKPDEPREITAKKYQNAYFVGYDLKTEAWRVKASPVKHGYIMQIGADRKNKLIYGLLGFPFSISYGNRLVCWDLKKDTVRDLGVINYDTWLSRDMIVDDSGRVFWGNHGGSLGMYDPVNDQISVLEWDIVPMHESIHDDMVSSDSSIRSTAWYFNKWRWILRDPLTKEYYGMIFNAELLFKFDPFAATGKKFTPLCSLTVDELAREGKVGLRSLGACQAGRRIFYNTWDAARTAQLVVYNIDTGIKKDLGPIVTPDGRKNWMCHAAAGSPDGRYLYLVLWTYVHDDEKYFSTEIMPWEDTFRNGDKVTVSFTVIDLEKDIHNVTLP